MNEMNKYNKIISLSLIILFLLNFSPSAQATNIEIIEKKASLSIEIINSDIDELIVNIILNPNNIDINAVGMYLNYASTTLEAIEINNKQSFCKFFIIEAINSNPGQVSVLCGLPNPGINSEEIITQIKFKKITPGWSEFKFDSNSMVLANDGLGTNVLGEINDKNVYLD